jgi:tetratricopeptide (TPR) repeat protein
MFINPDTFMSTESRRCSLTLFIWLLAALANPSLAEVQTAVEQAAVAQKWEEVYKLLGTDVSTLTDPCERILAGQACVTKNKCDEAFRVFASLTEQDIQRWNTWTASMASKHAGTSGAHFLRGDSLARAGKWQEALEAFNQALKTDPGSPLALNARGIVHVALQQWDAAIDDFASSSAANPDLADSAANLGTLFIHKGDGAEGALESFGRARKRCPDSAIIVNGQACAWIALGKLEEAEIALNEAEQLNLPHDQAKYAGESGISPVLTAALALNRAELARIETKTVSELLSNLAQIDAGMSEAMIVERINNMPQDKQAELKTVIPSALRFNKLVDFAGSWMRPLTPDAEIGIKGDVRGSVPPAKLSIYGSLKWSGPREQFEVTKQNMAVQQIVSDTLTKNGMQPARLGPIDQVRVRIQNRDLLSPKAGGITSKAIAAAPVDRGDWNLVSFYTLYYPLARPDTRVVPERKSDAKTPSESPK